MTLIIIPIRKWGCCQAVSYTFYRMGSFCLINEFPPYKLYIKFNIAFNTMNRILFYRIYIRRTLLTHFLCAQAINAHLGCQTLKINPCWIFLCFLWVSLHATVYIRIIYFLSILCVSGICHDKFAECIFVNIICDLLVFEFFK